MDNKEYNIDIENTNIIPIPEEARKLLNTESNKSNNYEKKLTKKNCIILVVLFMVLVVTITSVIYKMIIAKWKNLNIM